MTFEIYWKRLLAKVCISNFSILKIVSALSYFHTHERTELFTLHHASLSPNLVTEFYNWYIYLKKLLFYSGQNKNNYVLQYLAWRLHTKKSTEIELNFMLAGHTKFAPDQHFGTFKKVFKRTFVSSLSDIKHVSLSNNTIYIITSYYSLQRPISFCYVTLHFVFPRNQRHPRIAHLINLTYTTRSFIFL